MLEHDAGQAKWFYGFLESLFGSRTGGEPFAPDGAVTDRQ
jgi:hypothetical protein